MRASLYCYKQFLAAGFPVKVEYGTMKLYYGVQFHFVVKVRNRLLKSYSLSIICFRFVSNMDVRVM